MVIRLFLLNFILDIFRMIIIKCYQAFTKILARAYKKGDELNKENEAHIKRKNKPIKFKKTK